MDTIQDRQLLRFIFLEYDGKGPDRDDLDKIDTAEAEYPRYFSRASSYSVESENVNIVIIRLKSESIALLSFSCRISMHQTSVHSNESHKIELTLDNLRISSRKVDRPCIVLNASSSSEHSCV